MKKTLGTKIFVGLSLYFLSSILIAHEHETCSEGRSCWFLYNNSTENISYSCSGYARNPIFGTKNMQTNKTYSYQFCTGWGDGMGYPESGTPITCHLSYEDGRKIAFDFKTLNWGDKISFHVDDNKITATLEDMWSGKIKVIEAD